jgi:hypothetical protein
MPLRWLAAGTRTRAPTKGAKQLWHVRLPSRIPTGPPSSNTATRYGKRYFTGSVGSVLTRCSVDDPEA